MFFFLNSMLITKEICKALVFFSFVNDVKVDVQAKQNVRFVLFFFLITLSNWCCFCCYEILYRVVWCGFAWLEKSVKCLAGRPTIDLL